MNYYKVKIGYDKEAFISIDSSQLQAAYIAFITEQKAILGGHAIRGKDIIAIEPDINRMMGWNTGYTLGSEDWSIWNRSQKRIATQKEMEEATVNANMRIGTQTSAQQNNLLA